MTQIFQDMAGDENADIRKNIATPALGEGVRKTVAFDGSAGNGAVGTVNLFTVTGDVICRMTAVCTEDLAGATATLEVGVAGNTAFIIAQSTGTDIDVGEIWHDATPDSDIELKSDAMKEFVIAAGADIIATVGTANITDGTIEFNCFFEPISANGEVLAA